jgi:flagellar biosynthesis component FlhA
MPAVVEEELKVIMILFLNMAVKEDRVVVVMVEEYRELVQKIMEQMLHSVLVVVEEEVAEQHPVWEMAVMVVQVS